VSALTTEEPSVQLMYLGLSELIGSLDKPLHEIAKELEVNLKYLALELPVGVTLNFVHFCLIKVSSRHRILRPKSTVC
jgi:hypothetical protein